MHHRDQTLPSTFLSSFGNPFIYSDTSFFRLIALASSPSLHSFYTLNSLLSLHRTTSQRSCLRKCMENKVVFIDNMNDPQQVPMALQFTNNTNTAIIAQRNERTEVSMLIVLTNNGSGKWMLTVGSFQSLAKEIWLQE